MVVLVQKVIRALLAQKEVQVLLEQMVVLEQKVVQEQKEVQGQRVLLALPLVCLAKRYI
jgi:hypothetical protein